MNSPRCKISSQSILSHHLEQFLAKHILGFRGHTLTLPVFSHHPEMFLARHIQGFMVSPSTLTNHPLSLPVTVSG